MSFLILSFRKLSLRRKINNGNFRNMQLQMAQDKIQSQIADAQKLNAQMQDNWTSLTSSLGNISNSIFAAQDATAKIDYNNAKSNFDKASEAGNKEEAAKYEELMKKAEKEYNEQAKNILQLQNNQAVALSAMKQSVNSIYEASQKAQLEDLQRKDQAISLERESLQDPIATWNAEYTSLEKAVSEAAKNSAPKYCG